MEPRQYQPSGICIGSMRASQTRGSKNSLKHYVLTDILMNGVDENEEAMTGIGDREFERGDTLNYTKRKGTFHLKLEAAVSSTILVCLHNHSVSKTDHHLNFHCCKNIRSHIFRVGFSLQDAAKDTNDILDTLEIFLNTEF